MYTSPNYSENYEWYCDFKLQEKLRQSAEALGILDRNTVLYMLEEQEKELKEQAAILKLAGKLHLSPETAQEKVTQYWGN